MVGLKILGEIFLLGVIVNTVVVGWAWYHHTLAWPRDVPEGKEGSYFWEVYIGIPSMLLNGLLGFLGGLLFWQNWYAPIVSGCVSAVLLLVFSLLVCLVVSKIVPYTYPE